MLVVDETGFLKKGTKSAGVQRHFGDGRADRERQVGVFLAYASRHGHALIDRELYLPELAQRSGALPEAAIPDAVGFCTKPQLAWGMLERALEAEIPVAWVTGDEVYGGDGRLRRWLEERDVPHVLAVKRSEALWSMGLRQERAGKLAGQVPAGAWRQLSARGWGQGPAGLRLGQGADPATARARSGALAAATPPPGRWGAGLLCVLWAGTDDLGRAGPGGGGALDGGMQLPAGQGRDRA